MDAIKKIAAPNAELLGLVQQCEALLYEHYGDMGMYDFRQLRETLGLFLQDRKIKVSLFLQDETQEFDGSIKVQRGGALPQAH